jgi:hypothetical protein
MRNRQITFLNLNLLLLACAIFLGCEKVRIVDLDEEIKIYLESSVLLHDILEENSLSGYEYSSFRKEGLSLQAFFVDSSKTSYIIADLHREGASQYRLRAVRYIEGKVGTSSYKKEILYLEK